MTYIQDAVVKSKESNALCINSGSLQIDGGTIENEDYPAVYIGSNASAVINVGCFTSNLWQAFCNDGKATINGGVYTTKGTNTNASAVFAGGGTLNLKGGFFGGSQKFVSVSDKEKSSTQVGWALVKRL